MEVPLMLPIEQESVVNIIPREILKFEEWELTTFMVQSQELTLIWDGRETEEEYKQIAYICDCEVKITILYIAFFTMACF